MGRTNTSKLLAAKRPRLMPVHDSRIEAVLYPGTRPNFWEAWCRDLTARHGEYDALCQRLRRGRSATEMLGTLRMVDVAVWSYARHNGLGDRHSGRPVR